MSRAREERIERLRARRAERLAFGDPETIRVEQLDVGDFVVGYPTQHGVRGARIESTVVWKSFSWGVWKQGRIPVSSTRIETATRGVVDLPDVCEIVVRRPVTR